MKGLINRITKLWEEIKEAGIFSSIWMALFIGILIFLIFSAIGAEERSLMERSRTLQEVLKLIESERKNFTDKSLYNRIIKTIESRALNNAVILHQITAEHALFREWAETADEEPKESEKGSQNEGKY